MRDVQVAQLAGRQFNRVSRGQLVGLGLSESAITQFWSWARPFETITRPGSGGPRRHGGVLAYRSSTLDGECGWLRGIPITSVSRTLLDLSRMLSDRALARAVREAVRLDLITLGALGDALGVYRDRRGSRRLAATVARYSGLPLERARVRKQVGWEAAGWTVRRLPSDDVYERPNRLLSLAPPSNVPEEPR